MTTTDPRPARGRARGRIGTAPDEGVRPARTSIEQEEVFGPVGPAVPHGGGADGAPAIAGGAPHGAPGTARADDRERAAAFAAAPRPTQDRFSGETSARRSP
ncbi:hypothetical protein F8568_034300 [Actinomadura sp. LD22]|uniref:Aldehyde dehydrogenase family protein n=1 Tax=Actinomadura physcomitrii TaxID=2650748 RepID=A0A6I4MN07_9ACTN|nr:hypothetical protein [Actinomadura physcomitrii]MWA04704.1 hypothetical protein [Actinomadura physcomitrii]MWA05347.1 hypothetical protein [Actinomadura physcomitrii]